MVSWKRSAIMESLLKLLDERPLNKISVKDIVEDCGISRGTFYYHFQDKYDLLAYIVQKEILEPVGILLGNNMYKEALTLIFSNLKKDSAFYEKAVRIEGQNSFEQITEECIYKLLLDLFAERSSGKPHTKHPWLTIDSMARYYARSMNYVVIYWIRSGMTVPPEEVANIYEYVVTRSLWDVLEEL